MQADYRSHYTQKEPFRLVVLPLCGSQKRQEKPAFVDKEVLQMNKLSDEQLNHISGGDTALFDIYIDEMRQKYHVDSESLLFS